MFMFNYSWQCYQLCDYASVSSPLHIQEMERIVKNGFYLPIMLPENLKKVPHEVIYSYLRKELFSFRFWNPKEENYFNSPEMLIFFFPAPWTFPQLFTYFLIWHRQDQVGVGLKFHNLWSWYHVSSCLIKFLSAVISLWGSQGWLMEALGWDEGNLVGNFSFQAYSAAH